MLLALAAILPKGKKLSTALRLCFSLKNIMGEAGGSILFLLKFNNTHPIKIFRSEFKRFQK